MNVGVIEEVFIAGKTRPLLFMQVNLSIEMSRNEKCSQYPFC